MAKRAGPREWVGLVVLALPALLISIDFSVLTLAVPKISETLQPSASGLLWAVDIYGFMLAGFLVIMGSLGDKVGRRKLLLMGASVFGIMSIVAAFSENIQTLSIARGVLGIAGATLLPSTLALISAMFPDKRQRATAIAIWSTSLPIGGAIGPLIGGLLLNYFWWGSVFLLNVPVMLVLVVLGPMLLPEYRNPKGTRTDIASAGLALAAILTVVYGLQEITAGVSLLNILIIALGVGIGVVFVIRQRRLSAPLVDVHLFHDATFSAALVANLLSYFVIIGILMLFAQYLQLVLGLSPLAAGLWTIPAMGGLIGGSLITPSITKKMQTEIVICIGLILAALGFFLLSLIGSSHGLGVPVSASVVFSIGVAIVTTLVVNVVLASAPHEQAGAASGLSETSTELGGALGIAGLGTLASIIYRERITHLPNSLSSITRTEIKSTLGGATEAAHHLAYPVSTIVTSEAKRAFSDGLRAAAITSAAIMFILATAMFGLLHVRRRWRTHNNQAP